MKTILLMRHAKAEPGVPGQRDFDRSLSPRGQDDAARMGRAIAKLGTIPDAIVPSWEGDIEPLHAIYATAPARN
jgi:phosphohistidine phosphatase